MEMQEEEEECERTSCRSARDYASKTKKRPKSIEIRHGDHCPLTGTHSIERVEKVLYCCEENNVGTAVFKSS